MARTIRQHNARSTALIPPLPAYEFTTLSEALAFTDYVNPDVGKLVTAQSDPGAYFIISSVDISGAAELLPFSGGGSQNISNLSGVPATYSIPGASITDITVTALNAQYDVELPNTDLTDGQIHSVKDGSGTAGANNIVLQGNGKNIDGAASYTLGSNYESVRVRYNATLDEWLVVGFYV